MAKSHGKDTVVLLNSNDLSQWLNDSSWTRTPDSHDVTTYGNDNHVFDGGLGNGTTPLAGIYDTSTTSGPAAVIQPLVGTVVPLVYRPEGTGAGKPERSVNVLVGEYQETHPVADYVMWTVNLQHSGDVTLSTQTSS
jgi:hypothetical protein